MRRDVLVVFILLASAGLAIVGDVAFDLAAGAGAGHVAGELAAVLAIAGTLGWIWRQREADMRTRLETSEERRAALEDEAKRWRAEVAALTPSLRHALDGQFASWGFTGAEQEVARLILKGLANKEIATVRQCSEQTIKQQAHAIYRKSGLTSRAQLAAFFLDDLF